MRQDAITPIVDVEPLRRGWRGIFASTDPFDVPFRSDVSACMIFYPTEGYHLTEAQYAAVTGAARQAGETRFVLSVVEYAGDFLQKGDHWACAYPEYQAYASLPLGLENALYSERSRWGVLVSHEGHAMVGGSDDFIRRVRELYPDWQADVARLREDWRENPNGAWVEITLRKIERHSW
jgi:hypothetical protein